MANYKTWASLNLKGKDRWGTIFFEGSVPIKTIAAQRIAFDAISDPESVFSMDWKELTEGQQQVITEKFSQSCRSKEKILAQIAQSSVPLPRSFVLWLGVGDKTFSWREPLNDSIQ